MIGQKLAHDHVTVALGAGGLAEDRPGLAGATPMSREPMRL
jgi:hypothetical protein